MSNKNKINWTLVSKIIAAITVSGIVLYFPTTRLGNITIKTIYTAKAVEVIKNKTPEVIKKIPSGNPILSDCLLIAGIYSIGIGYTFIRKKIFPWLS
jgi:hypothetical protein